MYGDIPDCITYEQAYIKLLEKVNYTEDWDEDTFVKLRMLSMVDPVSWTPDRRAVVAAEWKWQMDNYA